MNAYIIMTLYLHKYQKTNTNTMKLLKDIYNLIFLRCRNCGERMYIVVRAHHHTEDGVDVTK